PVDVGPDRHDTVRTRPGVDRGKTDGGTLHGSTLRTAVLSRFLVRRVGVGVEHELLQEHQPPPRPAYVAARTPPPAVSAPPDQTRRDLPRRHLGHIPGRAVHLVQHRIHVWHALGVAPRPHVLRPRTDPTGHVHLHEETRPGHTRPRHHDVGDVTVLGE